MARAQLVVFSKGLGRQLKSVSRGHAEDICVREDCKEVARGDARTRRSSGSKNAVVKGRESIHFEKSVSMVIRMSS